LHIFVLLGKPYVASREANSRCLPAHGTETDIQPLTSLKVSPRTWKEKDLRAMCVVACPSVTLRLSGGRAVARPLAPPTHLALHVEVLGINYTVFLRSGQWALDSRLRTVGTGHKSVCCSRGLSVSTVTRSPISVISLLCCGLKSQSLFVWYLLGTPSNRAVCTVRSYLLPPADRQHDRVAMKGRSFAPCGQGTSMVQAC
jgi:hypothetical protein